MTSLVDVLFVVVFASLVSTVGMVRRADETTPDTARAALPTTTAPSGRASNAASALPPPPPSAPPSAAGESAASVEPRARAVPEEAARLRDRALAQLTRALAKRRAHFVRITSNGQVVAIESEGGAGLERRAVAVPLVARVADPDVVLEYLGDRSAELRLCAVLVRELGVDDLEEELVIIAPEAPLGELPVALASGLVRDVERCATQRGLAVLVGPDDS